MTSYPPPLTVLAFIPFIHPPAMNLLRSTRGTRGDSVGRPAAVDLRAGRQGMRWIWLSRNRLVEEWWGKEGTSLPHLKTCYLLLIIHLITVCYI